MGWERSFGSVDLVGHVWNEVFIEIFGFRHSGLDDMGMDRIG